MKKYILLTVSLFLLFAAGCAGKPVAVRENGVRDLDAQKARQMIQESKIGKSLVIIDVRSPQEFAEGHIDGAINVNVNDPEFENNLEKLDRNQTYLVNCRSGHRSLKACSIMADKGFGKVYNLFGGLNEWIGDGLPLVK